jgi:nucleoside 2-deoxyribosyltransferase
MYQYRDECLYIAGPECFYPNGYDLWEAMGKKAEYYGFRVVMPTRNELRLDHEDPQKNADTIFANCARAIRETTAIITDLEQFRGSEPDGGSLFEMGMAYANGARCYGFTRDKRDMRFKHQSVRYREGAVYDWEDRCLPYQDIPFCPSLIGAAKIIEGSFDDCLRLLMIDIDEERKSRGRRAVSPVLPALTPPLRGERPIVYLAGPERFDRDAPKKYAAMKKLCHDLGWTAVSPLDEAYGIPAVASEDPYTMAYHQFDRCQANICGCDILLADLNDFHGNEPNSDVAFECGLAWQLGKKCFGYMSDTRKMRQRIPNLGTEKDYQDYFGFVVENFDYPINLMFASSMPILKGGFEKAAREIAGSMPG